jgi:radical SAM protein with 4Fe4S-binding SPASM domain
MITSHHIGPLWDSGVKTIHAPFAERVQQLTGYDTVQALGEFQTQVLTTSGIRNCQILLDTGCNQDCIHCFLGEKHPVSDLGTVERLALRDLPRQGIAPSLYFTEPFAGRLDRERDLAWFDKLVALAAANQRRPLLSNGIAIDEDVARILKRHAPLRVYISLLGGSVESHEIINQRPGSFERVCDTLGRLGSMRSEGISLAINMMIHRRNLSEFESMVEMARRFKAVAVYLIVLHPGSRPNATVDDLCLGRDDMREFVTKVGELRLKYHQKLNIEIGGSIGPNFHTRGVYRLLKSGASYCPAGRTLVALHPETGKVFPCMKLSGRDEYQIGYWDSERRLIVIDPEKNILGKLATEPDRLKGECALDNCVYAPVCRGGCRAVAAAYSDGDLLAGVPHCLSRIVDEM